MKRIGYLIIVAVLFSNSFGMLPSRAQAQQQSDEEMARLLLTFIQAVYPWSQRVLTHFSLTHNVQVDSSNFKSQVRRIYPKTYKYAQEQFRRELGLVNISLPNGAPPKAGGAGWYGALLGLFYFQVQHYRAQDESRERFCREDLTSASNNYTPQEAEKECNWQTDQAFELADVLTIINPLGVPARFYVRLEEWFNEQGQNRRYSFWYYLYEGPGHRRPRPPQNQRKPPADSTLGGPGCGFGGAAYTTTSSFGPNQPPGFVGPPQFPQDFGWREVTTTVDFGCDGLPGTQR